MLISKMGKDLIQGNILLYMLISKMGKDLIQGNYGAICLLPTDRKIFEYFINKVITSLIVSISNPNSNPNIFAEESNKVNISIAFMLFSPQLNS